MIRLLKKLFCKGKKAAEKLSTKESQPKTDQPQADKAEEKTEEKK